MHLYVIILTYLYVCIFDNFVSTQMKSRLGEKKIASKYMHINKDTYTYAYIYDYCAYIYMHVYMIILCPPK